MAKDGTRRGRPKGSKGKKTLDKEAARELLRSMVKVSMGPMIEAQVKNAQGISYLVYRDKKGGKFTKVKADEAETILGRDDVLVEVWEERPSVQAFTDLMNRTIDKPVETVQATVTMQGLDERLRAAKKRKANLGN